MNSPQSKESVIIGTQLEKARQLLQLERAEVAHELNVIPQDIHDWEIERSQPTLKLLERLAELYGRQIDYFLKKTPDPPRKIEFRGKPGQSLKELSRENKIVLAKFDDLCRLAFEFENLLNKKRDVQIPRYETSAEPKAVAQSMRRKLHADDRPLPDLRERLEIKGARIYELVVPGDAFSGFSFWHSDYGPCILLNTNELKGRKNFTLAHELAHLLYGFVSSLCYIPVRFGAIQDSTESKANQFAIELLLPEMSVNEDFSKRNLSITPSPKELGYMANKWGTSIQALGYRLEKLGLIQVGHTDALLEEKPFLRRSRTPKWEKQLGKEFVGTTLEAYQKGLISVGKVADGLGLTVREAMKIVEKQSKKQT
jgi:Zn-dependent peptidase ImmA (M78 family)/DNA-binding XRE family transcriptional regulator